MGRLLVPCEMMMTRVAPLLLFVPHSMASPIVNEDSWVQPVPAFVQKAGTCKSSEYCRPDAKHCLTPVPEKSCAKSGKCDEGQTCCPLTKICVTVGDACESPCEDQGSYCCPDAKHCLTPTNPGTFCDPSSEETCAKGEVCCPLTKLCVKVGAACDPGPGAAKPTPPAFVQKAGTCKSSEYCCPDAKHCLTPVPEKSCAKSGKCDEGQTCCPLTKICVTVGDACESP